jgi:hypothetical protein
MCRRVEDFILCHSSLKHEFLSSIIFFVFFECGGDIWFLSNDNDVVGRGGKDSGMVTIAEQTDQRGRTQSEANNNKRKQ